MFSVGTTSARRPSIRLPGTMAVKFADVGQSCLPDDCNQSAVQLGEYRGDPLYHASLSPNEYTELLRGIGFEVIGHAVDDWETGGGRTVWLTRAGQTAGAPRRARGPALSRTPQSLMAMPIDMPAARFVTAEPGMSRKPRRS